MLAVLNFQFRPALQVPLSCQDLNACQDIQK